MKIFFLDDEPDLCDIFRSDMETLSTSVEVFTSGEELLRRAQEVRPDIVFLDFRLGGIDGEEVARRLDQSVPKVLITGAGHREFSYPFLEVINKPFRLSQIRSILEDFETGWK